MRWFDDLPTLGEVRTQRRVTPKVPPKTALPISRGMPKKKPETDKRERACRAAVWRRDQGKSRASGVPLVKQHPDERQCGEVAHLAKRSTAPAKRWDPANCVLLTAEEHRLSDARTAPGGTVLLIIKGKDARKTLTFERRDPSGRVLWARKSAPPKHVKEVPGDVAPAADRRGPDDVAHMATVVPPPERKSGVAR